VQAQNGEGVTRRHAPNRVRRHTAPGARRAASVPRSRPYAVAVAARADGGCVGRMGRGKRARAAGNERGVGGMFVASEPAERLDCRSMRYRADLELTAGILRLVPADLPHGAPFDLALVVTGDDTIATLKALRADVTLSAAHKAAIFAALHDAGFARARWHRHAPDGSSRTFECTVRVPVKPES
jgi:hypothetical protein